MMRTESLDGLPWPRPGKHTRIARLTPDHIDELLRRRIARTDAAIAIHQDRIEQLAEFIRDHRGNPWGSRLTLQALEEEMDQLLSTEPSQEAANRATYEHRMYGDGRIPGQAGSLDDAGNFIPTEDGYGS